MIDLPEFQALAAHPKWIWIVVEVEERLRTPCCQTQSSTIELSATHYLPLLLSTKQ
jgi:hypothetical protein